MRHAFAAKRPLQLAGVLLIGLFLFGIFLGAAILPASMLSRLYQYGQAFLVMTLPATTISSSAPGLPVELLLQTAGLPQPASFPQSLPATAGVDNTSESILILPQPKTPSKVTPPLSDTPQAIIYCTHTSEEYQDGKRVNGQAGGVLEAARTLAESLEGLGIRVLLDETLHDISYNDSYSSSLNKLSELKQAYPEIELLIDVHRDSSIPGVNYTLRNDSGAYAKMMLIIGSDENLPHPNWQQNRAFAQQVQAAADQLQSGIMREARIYNGRYNQHLGSKAILVEIGSTDNTLEEAKRSAQVLAEAIANCLSP